MEHLWASHSISGSIPGVLLSSKNSFKAVFSFGCRMGSVMREEFSLHMLELAGATFKFKHKEVGVWSENVWIPMLASLTIWRSLCEIKR